LSSILKPETAPDDSLGKGCDLSSAALAKEEAAAALGNGAIQSDGQLDKGASFVSFSLPERGEGRDEGFYLTFNGLISPLYRNEILPLPITWNRIPWVTGFSTAVFFAILPW
jgi:hypothetical protein